MTASSIVYRLPGGTTNLDLDQLLERIRSNPPDKPMSEAEIEEIIHEVRRERRHKQ